MGKMIIYLGQFQCMPVIPLSLLFLILKFSLLPCYYYFTEPPLTLKSILVWIIKSMVDPAVGARGCCSARIG